jgi:hypothetical protein
MKFPRSQSGAALLVFVLIMVVGTSYMLISRLNEYSHEYRRKSKTETALNQAKLALLSYAMNYPELRSSAEKGPGFLPCPDQNNDGNPTSCGSSTTTTLRLGRLPFRILGLTDISDSGGERFWYAVSDNFKNTLTNDTVLNSDTPGLISVDGAGDIVAVIIAPGVPVGTQSGRPSNNPIDYLEDVNADAATGTFITSSALPDFNDRLITITRQELMAVVEQRVINEVRAVMESYRAQNGAYPWLAPFADPKADTKLLRGQARSASNDLVDTSVDFTKWGVANGDDVWNLTDGSRGIVTNVSADTLTIGGGLKLGTDNNFEMDDEYYVEIRALASTLMSKATFGSSGLILKDTNRDFEELGIKAGDVVDNISDGSSGIVSSVDGDVLTVTELNGGTDNDFSNTDDYRIRNNTGRATANTDGNGLTLEDTNIDFITIGIQTGDLVLVRNITDGSFGKVTAVSANQLTVGEGLYNGTNNVFAENDYYIIQRYSPRSSTRSGLLPIYFTGEPYTSGFDLEWSIPIGASVSTTTTGGADTVYTSAMSSIILSSTNHPGSITVQENQSACLWITKNVADCRGKFTADLTTVLGGDITGIVGQAIVDSGENFPAKGVKRGDKITNLTDSTEGIIKNIPGGNPDRLQISNITGQTQFSKADGHSYNLSIATAQMQGVASFPTTLVSILGLKRLYASGADFSDVQSGDIIENLSRPDAIGKILTVNAMTSPPYILFTSLVDGTDTKFWDGDEYRIHYNFVDSRKYEFNLQFSGNSGISPLGQQRVRDVCIGYGSDCTGIPADTAIPGDSVTNTVAINDYDVSGTLVATTSLVLPVSGASGSLRVSGLDYYLDVDDGDLPKWFIRNKWHQYVYIAYSGGLAPGAAGNCVPGMDCLNLSIQRPDGIQPIVDTEGLVVMAAGMPLPAQDRISGAISDYFEAANSVQNSLFEQNEITSSFNDQLRLINP